MSATVITSNRTISEWGTVFGDAVVATAILDRLLRLRTKRRSGLLQKTAALELAAGVELK